MTADTSAAQWAELAEGSGDEPRTLPRVEVPAYASAQEALNAETFDSAMQALDPLRVYLDIAVRSKRLPAEQELHLRVSLVKVRAEWRARRAAPARVRLVESLGPAVEAEAWVDVALAEMRARREREFRARTLEVL